MTPVTPGTILQPRDEEYAPVRVVGAADDRWVVEDVDEFGSGPYVLEAETAAKVYGVEEGPQRPDEEKGWQSLATAHLRPIIPPKPQTPEERFAAGTAEPVTDSGEGGPWAPIVRTENAPWLT